MGGLFDFLAGYEGTVVARSAVWLLVARQLGSDVASAVHSVHPVQCNAGKCTEMHGNIVLCITVYK